MQKRPPGKPPKTSASSNPTQPPPKSKPPASCVPHGTPTGPRAHSRHPSTSAKSDYTSSTPARAWSSSATPATPSPGSARHRASSSSASSCPTPASAARSAISPTRRAASATARSGRVQAAPPASPDPDLSARRSRTPRTDSTTAAPTCLRLSLAAFRIPAASRRAMVSLAPDRASTPLDLCALAPALANLRRLTLYRLSTLVRNLALRSVLRTHLLLLLRIHLLLVLETRLL
ncbi:hypothetical protein EDC01DRAFT_647811 [Geopyxis carbonaria]|nr:hypothetical protein EDC01DRAFT_647811 [Geopyxis carbonaria]